MSESVKPQWVIDLEAEPCHCVACSFCKGSGTVYYDLSGHVRNFMMDDLDSPEPCDECGNGVVEQCDRCVMLDDYYAEPR